MHFLLIVISLIVIFIIFFIWLLFQFNLFVAARFCVIYSRVLEKRNTRSRIAEKRTSVLQNVSM